jgi:hypothetical protein
VSQFPFGRSLLYDIPENLLHIPLESLVTNKHSLGRYSSSRINFPIRIFISHEIVNINLDLVEGYTYYGVGGTRGAAQRLARDLFSPPAGGNIPLCIQAFFFLELFPPYLIVCFI